jgi:prepilin-type N-terminal cleavage/methylation domain-containing protein
LKLENQKLKIAGAFSLIEMLIVMAIIGILAAIVLPEFQDRTTEARQSTVRDNLRILRKAIELYAFQHNGIPPGYPGNNPTAVPDEATLIAQLVDGHLINQIPENSFNGLSTIQVLANGAPFPAVATDASGWIYQPQTKNFRLDHAGADSKGADYISY